MILQRIPRTNRVQVSIPKTEQEFLGWKPGDIVMVIADKEADSITLKRIKENQNGKN